MITPFSKIKEVSIQLGHNPFWHGHLGRDGCPKFLGREKPLSRLMTVLKGSKSRSGAYLVTGFRGMGKTSLVHEAICRLNQAETDPNTDQDKFLSISLSLSYDEVRDLDVLRQIALQLYQQVKVAFSEILNVSIHHKLTRLIDHIESVVTNESGHSFSPGQKSFRLEKLREHRKKSFSYSYATPKEVERDLVQIFEEIDQLRSLAKKEGKPFPQIIFIIDELDKIEPDFVTVQGVRHPEDLAEGLMPGRQRREAIARLLASLKGFLNEAKAKFIFIGGREMYDASLADIADRESFYGSVFHDVIYVESFFKDRLRANAGVTQMTEAYLCHFLLPEKFLIDQRRFYTDDLLKLHTVYKYLKELQGVDETESKDSETRKARYKTIFLLQNFIIYLTYRSNGTPKKLALLFEQFVVERSINEPEKNIKGFDHENEIVFWSKEEHDEQISEDKKPPKNLFLRFNFRHQYEIGLTSNLYRPYVIIHSRYLKSLGDKLLFSTSYMMDYILKFHPHGFSWRNLEMIPDIILTNKDPNLRLFMRELLQFLSRMHVRETLNGMFEYRFYSKISNEIKLLSKISEPGAAAFNFTLDESQQIKHYYRAKLHEVRKTHQSMQSGRAETSHFVYSISFLHNILGDLHFYDKEYDEAIIHYMDAIQPIRERIWAGEHLSSHQVTHLVRTLLKYGMASEKIHAFDSLYAIYRQMLLDLPKLLEMSKLYPEEYPSEFGKTDDKVDFPLRRMQLYVRPHIFMLELTEKKRQDGITFYNLQSNLIDLCNLLQVSSKNRVYWIIDHKKNDIKEHNSIRINTLCADYFYNVGNILFFKNQNFPEAYKRYRKGFDEVSTKRSLFGGRKTDLKEVNLKSFVEKRRQYPNTDGINYDYSPSLMAYFYYRQAATELLRTYHKDIKEFASQHFEEKNTFKEYSDLTKIIFLLLPEVSHLTNTHQLSLVANLFSSLGDAVLTVAGPANQNIGEDIIELYGFSEIENSNVTKCLKKAVKMTSKNGFPFDNPVESAMVFYRIAGLFFYKSNRAYSYVFQYKKFMFVLKDWLEIQSDIWGENLEIESNTFINKIVPVLYSPMPARNIHNNDERIPIDIASRIFHAITWEADAANRPQILKYRQIFEGYEKEDTRDIYYNISTSQESKEIVILIEEIKMKLSKFGVISYFPKKPYLSPYDSCNHMFTRMQDLKLQCEWHYYQISAIFIKFEIKGFLTKDYFKKEWLRELNNEVNGDGQEVWESWNRVDDESKKKIRYHILDSLFCLHDVIRTLNLYGLTHITNHSLLGSTHSKLANWCRAFYNYMRIEMKFLQKSSNLDGRAAGVDPNHFKDGLYIDLKKLISADALFSLEPNYHDEQALEHFYHAIQTHKGGRAYRYLLDQMSFLEDDFNDNFSHFTAATERYRINSGVVRKKINNLKKKVDASQLYKYESYQIEE